jgi:hypothetical protein
MRRRQQQLSVPGGRDIATCQLSSGIYSPSGYRLPTPAIKHHEPD